MSSEIMHEEGRRLADMAQVLKNNGMPQETINMVLAARCGLPMQKIDGKSPCFEWVETDATPRAPQAEQPFSDKETYEERLARLSKGVLAGIRGMNYSEGVDVLASAVNEFLIDSDCRASIVLHSLVSSKCDES